MKKLNEKNDFFGLNKNDKVKVVRQASRNANKDQYELIQRHGGVNALKRFCDCTHS